MGPHFERDTGRYLSRRVVLFDDQTTRSCWCVPLCVSMRYVVPCIVQADCACAMRTCLYSVLRGNSRLLFDLTRDDASLLTFIHPNCIPTKWRYYLLLCATMCYHGQHDPIKKYSRGNAM